eukprot:COSAG04_NODE_330_length_16594_cov_25.794146_8_plen_265_part_00
MSQSAPVGFGAAAQPSGLGLGLAGLSPQPEDEGFGLAGLNPQPPEPPPEDDGFGLPPPDDGFGLPPSPPPRPRPPPLESAASLDPLVLEAFQRYDRDGSGSITREEMADMVAQLGLPVTEGYVDRAWDAYDVDGSGVLELLEFGQMMDEGIFRNALQAVRPTLLAARGDGPPAPTAQRPPAATANPLAASLAPAPAAPMPAPAATPAPAAPMRPRASRQPRVPPSPQPPPAPAPTTVRFQSPPDAPLESDIEPPVRDFETHAEA